MNTERNRVYLILNEGLSPICVLKSKADAEAIVLDMNSRSHIQYFINEVPLYNTNLDLVTHTMFASDKIFDISPEFVKRTLRDSDSVVHKIISYLQEASKDELQELKEYLL